MRKLLGFAPLALVFPTLMFGEKRPERWIVMFDDAPLARVSQAERPARRAVIAGKQSVFRMSALARGMHVTGTVDTLLNAAFVTGTAAQAQALKAMPGVRAVLPDLPVKRHLNKALDLVNGPAAWASIGGQQNAGTGVRIAILDTGIDQSHLAFQDSTLTSPPGYLKCNGDDCAYTNSKVIVARSYVATLALGSGTPEDSRPDDLTPRDRVGHGTAMAMIAAGNTVRSPQGSITGVAPRAWVGNYKIFGTPGVNDETFASVVIQALGDALSDGMDVALLSFGLGADWTYHDKVCGSSGTEICDPWANAVQNAAVQGMTIVTSAGNDGDLGSYPNLNSINTPGSAPAAITVGATTNSHTLFASVRLTAGNAVAPAQARIGSGPPLSAPFTAQLFDISSTGGDDSACTPLATRISGIALVRRGGCSIATKVNNAQKAGATGVVVYRDSGDTLYQLTGLMETAIPSVLISNASGLALKAYLATKPSAQASNVTIDPALSETSTTPDQIAYFSSQGPAIGDTLIKPELVAPGTGLYTATQKYDPNGDMYDASGYTVQQGTSFSAALVTGGVALAKQKFPGATPAQLKSMVVNTADGSNVSDVDSGGQVVKPARVTAMGAGKLNLANVVKTNVTVEPATLSFGIVGTGTLPSSTLKLTNISSGSLTLTLAISRRDASPQAQVSVTPSTLSLTAGQSGTVTVRLTGANPSAGSYEGAVVVTGGAVDLRIPYLYLVGDNNPANIAYLRGFDWVQPVLGQPNSPFEFKITDRWGVPVQGTRYQWTPNTLIIQSDVSTDDLGIGFAFVAIGSTPGEQTYRVTAGSLVLNFDGRARALPAIRTGGVVNAGSLATGAVAPGSYITIFGSALSPSTRSSSTPYLPLALANVSVSFDVPGALSVPGRLSYASDGQLNVQVPWELAGKTSVIMKVSIGLIQSSTVTLAVADYSPAFFEFSDNGTSAAAALDENFAVVYSANPVQRGHILQLYVNGLGPVDVPQTSGEVATAQPLARTQVQPVVKIGGQDAPVQFSGLAPNIVGLYQVNVLVPQSAGTGSLPLTLSINGQAAKASTVTVK